MHTYSVLRVDRRRASVLRTNPSDVVRVCVVRLLVLIIRILYRSGYLRTPVCIPCPGDLRRIMDGARWDEPSRFLSCPAQSPPPETVHGGNG